MNETSMIEKAIIANLTYAEAYNNLGLFILYLINNLFVWDIGDIALAINAYEQCIKIGLDSRNACQVKLEGDINQGVAFYKKAFSCNWHYAGAMYNLGVAYSEMHKFAMAILYNPTSLLCQSNPTLVIVICNNLNVFVFVKALLFLAGHI
ncbi:hypothetical protein P8452_71560 [Trifolium repens]|nr:hypothetical protein P8452_71560 [Trifolium repens]